MGLPKTQFNARPVLFPSISLSGMLLFFSHHCIHPLFPLRLTPLAWLNKHLLSSVWFFESGIIFTVQVLGISMYFYMYMYIYVYTHICMHIHIYYICNLLYIALKFYLKFKWQRVEERMQELPSYYSLQNSQDPSAQSRSPICVAGPCLAEPSSTSQGAH